MQFSADAEQAHCALEKYSTFSPEKPLQIAFPHPVSQATDEYTATHFPNDFSQGK